MVIYLDTKALLDAKAKQYKIGGIVLELMSLHLHSSLQQHCKRRRCHHWWGKEEWYVHITVV